MEKLQSSRPWRRKINGSSVMARSDYNDVFSVPPWQTAHAPFSIRLDDYSEIFDATSFASIPLLDLSMVDNGFETVGDSSGGCRAGVDYLDIFGSIGAGGFAASNEELFAEPKTSGVSSTGRRTRWDVLPEQQEKEASEHPLKLYTENYEPNLEMKQHSSFPRQSDDVRSKKFSMPYHRMSQETIDNESKNKAVNKGTIDNTGAKGYTPGGGQKNFAVNPPEPNYVSLLDVSRDEKPNSRSHSYHATAHDVACLKVSEISLQTKPFKGPPPTRPPPTLSMKPEHPKVLSTDLRDDVEEGSSLKSKVNNQLHFSSEATKTHTIDDSINGFSLLRDTEMDPSSAAAVSIAAIKEAMEQAQVRLMIAKKFMDRKRAKSHLKVGPPKAMNNEEDGTSDEVTLKSCSKGIDSNNLLKESNTNIECTFEESEVIRTGVKIHLNHEDRKMQLSSYRKDQQQVSKDNTSRPFVEREEIRTTRKIPLNLEDRKLQLPICKKDERQVRKDNSSKSSELTCKIVDVAGEWKIDNEYYELLRNGRFFSTVKGIHIQGDEEKAKAAICSCEDKEKHGKDSEQAIEVEQKQKSMEVIVCIEKLEKDNKLKVPSFDCMEEADKNLADANMDEFLLKDRASDLEKDYGPLLSDENQKQCETHHDKNNENNVNKLDSVVDCCLYEEKIKKLGSNIYFKPWVANGNCEEKNLQAAERKFNVSLVECDVNESNKEVKVQNETLCYDIFEKKIKVLDELCSFNTTNRKGVDEEIKPSNHYENEARSMKHQDSCSAYRFEIEEDDNATEKDENDEFQTNEEAHILVENNLEQEAIQDENGLENGLEIPEAQGKIKDAELEKILNSREGTCRNDCNEKETREVRTSFQKDDESVGAHKISEFLGSAEGVCGKRVSEKTTAVPVLVETQISSNSADEACQQGEIEESDTGKACSSGKEGILLAAAQDATKISHVEKAGNYRHFLYTEAKENKSKMNVDWERDRAETCLEEKDLDREKERERIAAERANYKASQQELAEALVRAERIAVERATAEARQRALAESRQKAEKAAEAEKASREARLRAERAAVERATEEARKRAIEKALAEKAAVDAKERTAQVSASDKNRSRNDIRTEHFKATRTQQDSEAKYNPTLAKNQQNAQFTSSANYNINSDSHNNVGGAESKLNKASKERQQQTAERAAKALAERNMRDILAQREQVERDRLAESLDGEVRRWSIGKDGNLRALLSTLQYILGPDSGWQPIPLTDIMNASAAKKAYRKATLCVHPDKLQQRGASIQQKYICEKVFDLLQEAWNKFNSEER